MYNDIVQSYTSSLEWIKSRVTRYFTSTWPLYILTPSSISLKFPFSVFSIWYLILVYTSNILTPSSISLSFPFRCFLFGSSFSFLVSSSIDCIMFCRFAAPCEPLASFGVIGTRRWLTPCPSDISDSSRSILWSNHPSRRNDGVGPDIFGRTERPCILKVKKGTGDNVIFYNWKQMWDIRRRTNSFYNMTYPLTHVC